MNSVSTLERPASGNVAPGGGDDRPPSFWARLGGRAYDGRRFVLAARAVVLVGVFGALAGIGTSSDSSFESPDSESAQGFEILEAEFGSAGSFLSGSIVFEAEQGITDPTVQAAMTELFDEVELLDDATVTSPYTSIGEQQGLVAPDGTIAYATVSISDTADEIRAAEIGEEHLDAAE